MIETDFSESFDGWESQESYIKPWSKENNDFEIQIEKAL